MVVKATADALERVGKVVSALHSYDIPEVIALAVAGGNAALSRLGPDGSHSQPGR